MGGDCARRLLLNAPRRAVLNDVNTIPGLPDSMYPQDLGRPLSYRTGGALIDCTARHAEKRSFARALT